MLVTCKEYHDPNRSMMDLVFAGAMQRFLKLHLRNSLIYSQTLDNVDAMRELILHESILYVTEAQMLIDDGLNLLTKCLFTLVLRMGIVESDAAIRSMVFSKLALAASIV